MGKICSRCKIERPLSDYWGRPSAVDGLRGRCIPCCKEQHADWYAKNRERKLQVDKQYYQDNKQAFSEYGAAYYQANKEHRKATHATWAAKNQDKIREINIRKRERNGDHLRAKRRQHYRENSARYKAQAVARKEHIRIATPPWADLKKIEAIYAEAERLTKKTGIPHHVDHIYPLRGKTMCGLHVEGNLQILHAVVNLSKSNRFTEGISGAAQPSGVPGENCVQVTSAPLREPMAH